VATLAGLADELRLPLESGDRPGLRAAQLAAVHAATGHFWGSSRPALVVMPTGSGKTAVMTAISILLRANRVLVVCPSRLLREQLRESFSELKDLRTAGALDKSSRLPKAHEVKGKLTSRAKWTALRKFDVTVGTPSAISPGAPGIFVPPTDLFDLVLFDEAHHVPAKTYTAIAQAFPAARQVLFTATPFRRDEREIRADLVFTYELSQARRDGIFGRLHYRAVEPNEKQGEDVAIAVASAAQLRADRARGFDHRLVVRASSRDRADELADLYAKHTKLSLRRLHSGLSSRSVKKTVDELRAGKIDGVVVVDMLGEGFDLPQLKVAALHAPHRSLAVTLQFIGRFARTTAPNLGPATFFAVARDVEAEAQRLFVPGAEWNEIVEDLSRQRLAVEQETRATIASFETVEEVAADVDSRERQRAILWGLRPYFHVKIYETTSPVDLDAELNLPADLEPVLIQKSREENTIIWIGRSTTPIRWSSSEALADVSHDMFLVVNVPEHRLLFICTSRRSNSVYDDLVGSLTDDARRLAPNEITRVLRGIDNQELFSVGMRNRAGVGGGASHHSTNDTTGAEFGCI
jgi:superfamily II DNA or RNA helicase